MPRLSASLTPGLTGQARAAPLLSEDPAITCLLPPSGRSAHRASIPLRASWVPSEPAVCLPQVIYLKKTPEEAYRALLSGSNPPYLPFRYGCGGAGGGRGQGRRAGRLALSVGYWFQWSQDRDQDVTWSKARGGFCYFLFAQFPLPLPPSLVR